MKQGICNLTHLDGIGFAKTAKTTRTLAVEELFLLSPLGSSILEPNLSKEQKITRVFITRVVQISCNDMAKQNTDEYRTIESNILCATLCTIKWAYYSEYTALLRDLTVLAKLHNYYPVNGERVYKYVGG